MEDNNIRIEDLRYAKIAIEQMQQQHRTMLCLFMRNSSNTCHDRWWAFEQYRHLGECLDSYGDTRLHRRIELDHISQGEVWINPFFYVRELMRKIEKNRDAYLKAENDAYDSYMNICTEQIKTETAMYHHKNGCGENSDELNRVKDRSTKRLNRIITELREIHFLTETEIREAIIDFKEAHMADMVSKYKVN